MCAMHATRAVGPLNPLAHCDIKVPGLCCFLFVMLALFVVLDAPQHRCSFIQ
jgi:hypothetical protein